MLLAGFTEVPVIGIHTMCISTRVNPIAKPANLGAEFPLAVLPKTTKRKIQVNTVSAMAAGIKSPSPKLLAPAWYNSHPIKYRQLCRQQLLRVQRCLK